jgi:hypothetical protein
VNGQTSKNARQDFLAVLVVSLVVQAGFLFVLCPRLHLALGGAFDGYHDVALQLSQGHGFALEESRGPTAGLAPLYPALLALIYWLFGTSATPVMLAHTVIGALTCALLFLLGSRIFDRAVGLVAGVLLALYPPRLIWSSFRMTESLLVLLIVASTLAIVALFQSPSHRRAIGGGVFIGLTALCNAVIVLLPLVLLLVAAVSRRLRPVYLRHLLALVAVMGLVILPWTVRNYVVFHRVIPVRWGAGVTFVKGMLMADLHSEHPDDPMWKVDQMAGVEVARILQSHGFEGRDPRMGLEPRAGLGDVSNLAEDRFLARLGWERLREDPGRAAKRFAANLSAYWYFSGHDRAYLLVNLPLLGLALLGLALGAWRRAEAWLVLLVCGYFYLSYATMMAIARYSLQIMPFVTLFASVALVALARRATRGPGPDRHRAAAA